MLCRLVITFLPRSKCLLISWLQSPSAVILEFKIIKSVTVSPTICHEIMGLDAMIFVFWMLSFKPTFSILRRSAFFLVQLSHPSVTIGKTIASTRWTFVGEVMSLLFNMLSRLVITFLPRSKRLLILWLQSPSAVILEPPQIVCHCFRCFPIYLPWSDGTGCHDVSFLNAEF